MTFEKSYAKFKHTKLQSYLNKSTSIEQVNYYDRLEVGLLIMIEAEKIWQAQFNEIVLNQFCNSKSIKGEINFICTDSQTRAFKFRNCCKWYTGKIINK